MAGFKPISTKTFYGHMDNVITAKCVLISENRFNVELSKFSEDAIQVFKTLPSRIYDFKTRNWNFTLDDHNALLEKMKGLKSKITLEPLPSFVLKCMSRLKTEVNVDLEKLDPALSSTLLPFQLEGLNFGVNKNGRCLIADDMGLGKTFQALAIANYYSEDWPVLIATTASMKTQWEETIMNYLPSVPVMHVQYVTNSKEYIGDARILIVSHNLLSRCLDKLIDRKFGVVIIDESHFLKSFKTKCYQSVYELSKRAKRLILLSGTPALSRPSELFTQLNLIDSKFFGSFHVYSKRYCDGQYTSFGWDASGKSNLQELEIILAKQFMIRRTKKNVLHSLPNKKQEIIKLDTNLQQFSEENRKVLLALGEKYNTKKGAAKHAMLLTFFSETAKIKIPSVCSYVLQTLESKVKFLIFAHHQVMMDAIEDLVKNKNVGYIRIDGATTTDQRKYLIDKFQLSEKYRCAVLSITATNAGITLTAAQLVLFAELHWNPSMISQAEARAHRLGQENQVIVRYLLAPGTADDSIWPMLQEKQKTLMEVGLSHDNFDEVATTSQNKSVALTGLDLNASQASKGLMDITKYFSPEAKRQKVEENYDDMLNDGMDEMLCQSFNEAEDALNDSFNDALCEIDF